MDLNGIPMLHPDYIPINEIILKSEKESGNLLILKEHALAESSLIMFVGEPEFLAIAKEKGLIQTPRPLTHELYLTILENAGIEFIRVEIYNIKDQTYFANVVYRLNQEEISADSRPSDAIALAMNQKIPILVELRLLKKSLSLDQLDTLKDFIRTATF
jgi:bifunctional DNase/RNase